MYEIDSNLALKHSPHAYMYCTLLLNRNVSFLPVTYRIAFWNLEFCCATLEVESGGIRRYLRPTVF